MMDGEPEAILVEIAAQLAKAADGVEEALRALIRVLEAMRVAHDLLKRTAIREGDIR